MIRVPSIEHILQAQYAACPFVLVSFLIAGRSPEKPITAGTTLIYGLLRAGVNFLTSSGTLTFTPDKAMLNQFFARSMKFCDVPFTWAAFSLSDRYLMTLSKPGSPNDGIIQSTCKFSGFMRSSTGKFKFTKMTGHTVLVRLFLSKLNPSVYSNRGSPLIVIRIP